MYTVHSKISHQQLTVLVDLLVGMWWDVVCGAVQGRQTHPLCIRNHTHWLQEGELGLCLGWCCGVMHLQLRAESCS